MNFIQRIIDYLPLPFSYCGYCECLHWHDSFKDEHNGAQYYKTGNELPWQGKHTTSDSNMIFACYEYREYIKQCYQDQWDEYWSSRY